MDARHNPSVAPCAEFERRLSLYAWQELEAADRSPTAWIAPKPPRAGGSR